MKIKITDFAKRHFDKDFGGTKILNYTIKDFEQEINKKSRKIEKFMYVDIDIQIAMLADIRVMNGYADFCKLVAIPNFTDAKLGSMPITLENYQYLRSGYSARKENELPVLSRWLELPLGKPKAEWLILVLYDKEQLTKEQNVNEFNEYKCQKTNINFINWCHKKKYVCHEFDGDWGIVAILGQSHPNEEPMKPETMLRNALGIEEGGSGVVLDRDKYLESVKFWQMNSTIK